MERFRGCLSSYNGHLGIFPSKADRIMSSYRRIAPKPTVPCASDVDKSASSAMSFDNLHIRQIPDASASIITPSVSRQKPKRVRKRPSKESDSSEPSKRVALMESVPNLAKKGVSHVSAGEAAPLNIQEDSGFMERAAASAPSSVFPLEKARKTLPGNAYGFGGGFTEMIRGIAGLPSAAHVHSLLQQQQHPLQGTKFLSLLTQEPSKPQVDDVGSQGEFRLSRDHAKEEGDTDSVWSCFNMESSRENADLGVSEEQQQSGLDEEKSDGEDDGRRRAVTLNLLPDAPTRAESPSISTCTSLRQSSEQGNSACGNSLVYVEKKYGRSVEPVVLVDDMSHTVLWVNHGYVKVCKESSASFMDLLGTPTQLGKLQVQIDDGRSKLTSATLWGFSKKPVVELRDEEAVREQQPAGHGNLSSEGGREKALISSTSVQQQKRQYEMPTSSPSSVALSMSGDSVISPRVFMPQPVRLIGSMVSLESITEVETRGASCISLEFAKKNLEIDSLPGFITDASRVVRWVNSAYKAMVGQPECPWLMSTMNMGGESPTITGEVLLSCNVEVPHSATSFSGRANVQWTRSTGERSCMTIPCDVSSLVVDGGTRRMLMWRFDIQASLSLSTVGLKR